MPRPSATAGIIGGLLLGLSPGLTPRAVARDVAEQEAVAETDATASQPGRIEILDRGLLEIAPYNPRSNLTHFWLDAGTPVFYGSKPLTTASLQSGTDVRVDFRRRSDGTAQTTAVFILTPLEAAGAQLEARNAEPQLAVVPDGINVPPVSPLTPADQRRKESLLRQANGSESGTVTANRTGRLEIRPLHNAGGPATFEVQAGVPVYNGGTELSTKALEPGRDVRVFYDERGGSTPRRAVVVEVLTKEELQRYEEQPGPGR